MWIFHTSTGEAYHDEEYEGLGYSGTGMGRNNPAMDRVRGVGPLPVGEYRIGKAYPHDHLGPCVMNLEPLPGTVTHGRDAFRIHGDNKRHDASHGCIVLGPGIRERIAKSGDRLLKVVA